MKLSLILAPLIAAKVPHDIIMDTILAFEAQQTDALEKRREADRNRQNRKRNGDVTLSHVTRSPSRSHAGVEDSFSKKDITGKIESKEDTSPPARSKRAMRLPADWVLPEAWLQEAIDHGLSRQRALSEAERMKNWSLSAKNGAKLDWLAAWRNWYRDKIDAQATSPPKKTTLATMWHDEARDHGILNDPPSTSNERVVISLPGGQNQGSGLARRYAGP